MSEPTDVQAMAERLRDLPDPMRMRCGTHWDDCWRTHRDCAILRAADALDAQQAEVQRLTAEREKDRELMAAILDVKNRWEMLLLDCYPNGAEIEAGYANVHAVINADRDAQVREAEERGFTAGWDYTARCTCHACRLTMESQKAAWLASRQPAGAQPDEPAK